MGPALGERPGLAPRFGAQVRKGYVLLNTFANPLFTKQCIDP